MRLSKPDHVPPINLLVDIGSPQVVTPPVEISPVNKAKRGVIKGKKENIETQEDDTLFEVFKAGKRPHTRPTNKFRYKIKLRNNPELGKVVIDVENMPLKDLIINRK